MKKYNLKEIKIIPVFIFFFFCTGFMFYRPVNIHWIGDIPVINFEVWVSEEAFEQSEAFQWIEIIQDSGLDFFKQAQAGVVLIKGESYAGQNMPDEFMPVSCHLPERKLSEIYTVNEEDRDCTSSSCVFLWRCEGRDAIISGDVQINLAEYNWTLNEEVGFTSIKREIMHDFGHLLGLDHCAPGEKNCNNDPLESSIMYKFTDKGVISLSEDDKSGLQDLYGKLSLPFPADGKYALSDEDINAITGIMAYYDIIGLNQDEIRIQFNDFFNELIQFSESKSEKSIEDQTHKFFKKAVLSLPGSTSQALRIGKKFNAMAIYLADRWIKDANEKGINPPVDLSILILARDYHIELREKSIDLLEGRR